jgi:hypothetical protein
MMFSLNILTFLFSSSFLLLFKNYKTSTMRKYFLFIIGLTLCFSTLAQLPQGFSYQAVIRDAEGKPIADRDVAIRIGLADNEAGTNPYYTEVHSKRTSLLGVISLVVGKGTSSDNFSAIPWSGGTIWMKVEVDAGSGYQLFGSTQLYSVPYALYTLNGVPGAAGADGKPGRDGLSIVWMGSYPTHPTADTVNNAYFNSADSTAYIWDGTAWQVLAMHGAKGKPGMDGSNGKSAYEVWVEDGHTGATVQDFIAALKGQTGETGVGIQSAILNTDSTLQLNFTNSTYYKTPIKIIGRRGATGPVGPQGPAGIGLKLKGTWSADSSYTEGDYVFHEALLDNTKNSMWICQAAVSSTTKPKDDPTHWVEFEAPSGPQGPRGEDGTDGVGIASISLNADSTLTITLSDMSTFTTDKKIIGQRGEKGEPGAKGQDGVGIQNVTLNADSTLTLYFTNATQYKTPVKIIGRRGATGPMGPQGPAGVGLTNKGLWSSTSTYVQGDYVFDESSSQAGVNSMWICQANVGSTGTHPKNDPSKWIEFQAPAGPQGDPGPSGVGIASVTLNADSTLTITMTDLSEFNTATRIVGKNGKDGVGIESITLNQDSTLTISLTNSTQFTTDRKIIGDKGEPGEMGPAGPLVEGVAGQTLTHSGSGWVATSAITIDADTVGIGTKKPLSKLVVKGDPGADPDAPIFEVRNKEGQVVLGVYNEGVRVYVANPSGSQVKGTRAGFAVGGLTNQAKGEVEYFRITPDSARIYVNETSSGKGTRGGFAVGGLTNQAKETTARDLLYIAPEEARIYVKDTVPAEKGTRGGFAVGGLTNQAKGVTNNYLYIHRDSSRIYIDDTQGKGTRGGFAVGGLTNQAKGGDANFMNIETQSSMKESKPRILWYPLKNAFLVGQVKIDSPDSVGVNSLASGYETMARGEYSQALGYQSKARGDYSMAIGKYALAHTTNTFAFGDNAKALKGDAYAFGAGAIASGLGSYAIGSVGRDTSGVQTSTFTQSSGDYSLAIGQGSRSTNLGSMSFGIANASTGKYSLALGTQATAGGRYSMALGLLSSATGAQSVSIGAFSTASGSSSIAMGNANATAAGSTAIGGGASATGENSVSISSPFYGGLSVGFWGSEAVGYGSVAIGSIVRSSGYNSVAIGHGHYHSGGLPVTYSGDYTDATGQYAIAIGRGVIAQAYASLAVGQFNSPAGSTSAWNLTDPLFVIGNGTAYDAPSNAFTVLKNGKVGILNSAPTYTLDVTGTGRTTQHTYLATTSGYNVGVGTTSPSYKLDVAGPINLNKGIENSIAMRVNGQELMWYGKTGNNVYYINWGYAIPYTNFATPLYVGYVGDLTGYKLYVAGNAYTTGTWGSSDIRWKKNIQPITNILPDLVKLQGVKYEWKADEFPNMNFDSNIHIGFIAQEVEKLFPELVLTDKTGFKSISYDKITAILVEGIKEQQLQIDSLANENAMLKEKLKELDTLKAELEAIKALLAK